MSSNGRRWPGAFSWRRLPRARRLSTLVLIAAGSLLLAWSHGRFRGERGETTKQRAPQSGTASTSTARVAHVDDGDTIRLDDGRQVRYLGIDAPEHGEPLYAEACAANRRLVEGREVDLRRGGPAETDKYGRLLAIVSVKGESGGAEASVNAAMLRAGLASVYLTDLNAVAEAELAPLLEAQRLALSERRGLWPGRLERAARRSEPLVATRLRIHQASCDTIRSRGLPTVRSLEAELRMGKSPCRRCKPLD